VRSPDQNPAGSGQGAIGDLLRSNVAKAAGHSGDDTRKSHTGQIEKAVGGPDQGYTCLVSASFVFLLVALATCHHLLVECIGK
jgi:hypothetical protein